MNAMKPHIRLHVSLLNKGDYYYAVIFSDRSKTKIIGATTTRLLSGVMFELVSLLETKK